MKVQDTLQVLSKYVPVNARTLEVASGTSLRKGDRILVDRPSGKEWIASLGCDIFGGGISALGWKEGDMDLTWDRTVTEVNGNQITLDAPLTVALDAKYGTSSVITYQWNGRIRECGVENMTLISDYDKRYPKDEDHCWTGISIEDAENCWVRRVNFKHFAGSAILVQRTGSHDVQPIGVLQAGLGVIKQSGIAVTVKPAAKFLICHGKTSGDMVISAGDSTGNALIVIFTAVKATFCASLKLHHGFRPTFFGHDVDQPSGTPATVQGRRAGDHFNMVDIKRIDRVQLSAVGT